jgi:hypothetical protein
MRLPPSILPVNCPQRDSNPRYHLEGAVASVSQIANTRGLNSFNSCLLIASLCSDGIRRPRLQSAQDWFAS